VLVTEEGPRLSLTASSMKSILLLLSLRIYETFYLGFIHFSNYGMIYLFPPDFLSSDLQ
jgi:hypothetical protein